RPLLARQQRAHHRAAVRDDQAERGQMSDRDSIEVEAATVDEAVAEALSSLGAQREDVDVEVMSSSSRGLFGLRGRRARVRVALRRAVVADMATPPRSGAAARTAEPRTATPELEQHARDLLADLLRRMGFDCAVTIDHGPDGVSLQIRGDNTNLLIGKH